MSIPRKASRRLVAASLTGMLALTACSTNSSGAAEDGAETLDVNAFSVMEAANEPVFEDFTVHAGGRGRRVRHVVRRVR